MSASITVTGNLTQDPSSRTTAQGHRVTNFGLASTARHRTPSGEWVDGETTYYKVACWRGKAERAAQCLRKGDAVIVQGRLGKREWTDKDGNIRTDLEVEADSFGPDLARAVPTVVRALAPAAPPAAREVDPWAGDIDRDGTSAGPQGQRPAA